MCDYSQGIKFCSCAADEIKYRTPETYKKIRIGGKRVDVPSKKNEDVPLVYIWHLSRDNKRDTDEGVTIGFYMYPPPPSHDIGRGLNAEWIALNLNSENCFDFEYTPQEGDTLCITLNDFTAPYISFIYKGSEWKVGNDDSFGLSQIGEGKVMGV